MLETVKSDSNTPLSNTFPHSVPKSESRRYGKDLGKKDPGNKDHGNKDPGSTAFSQRRVALAARIVHSVQVLLIMPSTTSCWLIAVNP